MANTLASTGLTPQQWDDKYFMEYIQTNRFAAEMGTSENNIIQIKEDLTKKRGDTVTFALVNRLTGAGVTGNNTLEGNEEALISRSFPLSIDQRRNAVVVSDWDEQKSAIDLRNSGREALMTWSMENTRDRIITALGSIDGVAYDSATAGQKNTWNTNNGDRILFGSAVGNRAAGDQAASLLNVDATDDKLTVAAASLMKRIALTANPKIRPIRVQEANNRRFYVAYCHPLTFRDLKADPAITQAQREVSIRMQNVKLFEGGDIEYDGIIFKEVDDMPIYAGVGAAGIDVSPVYLCGAQTVGYGIAKRWQTREANRDYDDKKGVAVVEQGNFAKLRFGTGAGDTDTPKDHGMVTGFFAAVADA